jgi:hypothetical protein
LKELESCIERGQNVPFLREKRPRKKCTPNIGANIGAITGILLKDGRAEHWKLGGKEPGKTTYIGNFQPKSY